MQLAVISFILFLIIIIRPKFFLYYFIAVSFITPIITVYFLEIPEPELFVFYLNNIPLRIVNYLMLFLTTLIYPISGLIKNKNNFFKTFKNSKKYIFRMIFIFLIFVFFQILLYSDAQGMFIKFLNTLIFPMLILNFTYLFPNLNSFKRIFNFNFLLMTFVIFLFIIYNLTPYVLNFSGLDFSNRLGNLLVFTSNGTSIFLLIFIFFSLIIKKLNPGYLINTLINLLVPILAISILLTFTKTTFFIILFLIMIRLFSGNLNLERRLFFTFSIILILVFYSNELIFILTRGEGAISFDFQNYQAVSQNSLEYRISALWIPSLDAIFSNLQYLLIGTSFIGFNEFISSISNLNDSSHNFFIQILVYYGLFGSFIYLLFFKNLLQEMYKQMRYSKNFSGVYMLAFFSVLSYFISINSMSTFSVFFYIPIALVVSFTFILSNSSEKIIT